MFEQATGGKSAADMSKELLKNLRSGEPVSPEQLAKILESGGIDMATGAKVVTFQKALARIGVSPQDLAAAVQLQKALKAQGNPPQAIIQVWPLIQFFLFPFCKKSLICLEVKGQINDPFVGRHYSLPFLPAAPSSPSPTLEVLFSGFLAVFKDPRHANCVASGTTELQGHRQV